jgi:hypothetical protein
VVDAFNTVRFDAENIGELVGVGVVGKILYMYVSLGIILILGYYFYIQVYLYTDESETKNI